MNTGILLVMVLCGALAALPVCAKAASGNENGAARMVLPAPDKSGGKPLMQALALRASNRSISRQPLPERDLSNILWAAWGVNRPDGRRTVPTARNTQAVALYAAKADGVWRYEGERHELVKVLNEDWRSGFGGAPLTLIYAAEEGPYAGMHVGSKYQNAGLYCASAGLGSVVKLTGADAADKLLGLKDGYQVMIVQPVGRPK